MRDTSALVPMLAAALFIGALPGTAALAQQTPDCKNWGNLPQQGMNQCAGIAYQDADDELNAVWANLRARRGEGHSWDPILEAQRAWISFRDAHCEAEAAPYEGGSIQPLIRFGCLEEATRQRTAQLRDFLQEP